MSMLVAAMLVAGVAPPIEVRRLIRDARAITRRDGEALWPGFARIPFHMILVEGRRETLFCHAKLAGFSGLRHDPVTGCTMQSRPRVNPRDASASMTIGDEPAMIVFGAPRYRGSDTVQWMVEVTHEAFHQFQARLPGYAAKVDALGLTGKDGQGSWMLDYPFPYARPDVAAAFHTMAAQALVFLQATTPVARRQAIIAYVDARRLAQAAMAERDWRYYEFQVGQEGIARWTDIMLAQAAARRHPRFRRIAEGRLKGVASSMGAIMRQGLGIWKRSAFYELGAAEAMMLDNAGPGWRAVYREKPFSLGAQLDALVNARPALG